MKKNIISIFALCTAMSALGQAPTPTLPQVAPPTVAQSQAPQGGPQVQQPPQGVPTLPPGNHSNPYAGAINPLMAEEIKRAVTALEQKQETENPSTLRALTQWDGGMLLLKWRGLLGLLFVPLFHWLESRLQRKSANNPEAYHDLVTNSISTHWFDWVCNVAFSIKPSLLLATYHQYEADRLENFRLLLSQFVGTEEPTALCPAHPAAPTPQTGAVPPVNPETTSVSDARYMPISTPTTDATNTKA